MGSKETELSWPLCQDDRLFGGLGARKHFDAIDPPLQFEALLRAEAAFDEAAPSVEHEDLALRIAGLDVEPKPSLSRGRCLRGL